MSVYEIAISLLLSFNKKPEIMFMTHILRMQWEIKFQTENIYWSLLKKIKSSSKECVTRTWLKF